MRVSRKPVALVVLVYISEFLVFTRTQDDDLDDPCTSAPCFSNGTCFAVTDGYSCRCATGFKGDLCREEIDECASSPCVNGTCVDRVAAYECTCARGVVGKLCDSKETNECASSPCRHGSACFNVSSGYSCRCSEGYKGIRCQQEIDECASSPCGNGTCTDGIAGYRCTCAENVVGKHCENLGSEFQASTALFARDLLATESSTSPSSPEPVKAEENTPRQYVALTALLVMAAIAIALLVFIAVVWRGKSKENRKKIKRAKDKASESEASRDKREPNIVRYV